MRHAQISGPRCRGSGARGPALPASQPHSACVPTACSRLGPGAHLTSAEVQVQVARVRVERKPFQKGPGRGCHSKWRELEKRAPGRERIPRRKGQDTGGRGGDRSGAKLWVPGLGGGRTRRGVTLGSDTDLSASGGSLQPARHRCRSVPARLRKSWSASGAARDFLGWASGRSGLPGAGRRLPAVSHPRPDPPPLRAGEDVPRGIQVAEAGAAAACQRCEELREEGVGYTGGGLSSLAPPGPHVSTLRSRAWPPALLIIPPLTTLSQCPGRCRCPRDSGTSEH